MGVGEAEKAVEWMQMSIPYHRLSFKSQRRGHVNVTSALFNSGATSELTVDSAEKY